MERNIIVTEALDARRQGIFYGIKNIHQDRNAAVFPPYEESDEG